MFRRRIYRGTMQREKKTLEVLQKLHDVYELVSGEKKIIHGFLFALFSAVRLFFFTCFKMKSQREEK